MAHDKPDPFQDLKAMLGEVQGELDKHHESEVVVAVPRGILGVFPDLDSAYLAAVAEVGPAGRFLLRGARGGRRATISFPITIGPAPSQRQVLRDGGLPIPTPMDVIGFLDTGADLSLVRPRIARQLGLPEVNSLMAQSLAGVSRLPVVMCEFSLAGSPGFTLRACVSDGFREEADAVIGLDIMRHATFLAEGGKVSIGLLSKPY